MRIAMIKCDVKTCGKLVEAEKGHSLVFAGKLYDFCDECFQEIDKWIQATLNEGQLIKEDKPKLPSQPAKPSEEEIWGPYIQPTVIPSTWTPYPINGDIIWTAKEASPGYKLEYTTTTDSTANLDFFDKWLNGKKD